MASLKELAAKGQRTVYRLTLVKGWNAEEIRNYANLVSIGNPDFIEIKGVTYCGTSKGNNLKRGNFKYLNTTRIMINKGMVNKGKYWILEKK